MKAIDIAINTALIIVVIGVLGRWLLPAGSSSSKTTRSIMNGTSPLDLVRSAEHRPERPSIEALAYSEPDVTSIASHVFEAHNRNKDLPPRHGKTKASITFNPAIGAIEIIPQSREALDVLRRLGAGFEVEISW